MTEFADEAHEANHSGSAPVGGWSGAAIVHVAVARLPEDEREAVTLAIGGLSYRQVAEKLGVAESAVKLLIRRALTRLALVPGPDVSSG